MYKEPHAKLIAMIEVRRKTKTQLGPRQVFAGPGRQWFAVGKYRVLSEPLPGATHMQRYSVFLEGRRIGTTVSVPSEADCLQLEQPRSVSPLKPFHVAYRAGRPKKGAAPRAAAAVSEGRGHAVPREDLPPAAPAREFAEADDD